MFWVFCVFLGTLILLCAWMLLAHQLPESQQASPCQAGPSSVAPVAVAGAGAGAASVAGGGAVAADYSDAVRLHPGTQ
jgi:hypothetical protein